MTTRVEVRRSGGPPGLVVAPVVAGFQWARERSLSIAYGLVYDRIFEHFKPYRNLEEEIRALIDTAAGTADRRNVRILDFGCGPGNFAFTLAEAGFGVVGLDPYAAVVDVAREKRRSRRLSNLAFTRADLAAGAGFRDAEFDQVISIHSLYVHPAPERVLREAWRVLKPGGHLLIVNHARRVGLRSSFTELWRREGVRSAVRALLWLVPNAVFEAARKPGGPHYWDEKEFSVRLGAIGFTVLEARRTFFAGASVLVWARKDSPAR